MIRNETENINKEVKSKRKYRREYIKEICKNETWIALYSRKDLPTII